MNLIVAVDQEWGIGYDGDLHVRLQGDLKNFQELTMGKVIILGRKTLKTFYDQKLLINRTHIILSRDPNYKVDGAEVVNSLKELFEFLQGYDPSRVFVIGGQQVYEQLLPFCDIAFVTKIHQSFLSDRYFPNLDRLCGWELMDIESKKTEKGICYTFYAYKNKLKMENLL